MDVKGLPAYRRAAFIVALFDFISS